MKKFDFTPGRNNILLLISECATMDELMTLWRALTPDEQKMAKPFFSRQKKHLKPSKICYN